MSQEQGDLRQADARGQARAAAVLADYRDGHAALTLNAVRDMLSQSGRRFSLAHVYRIVKEGSVAADGRSRVFLETARHVGRLTTSEPAIRRFLNRLNGLESTAPAFDAAKAHETAERRLAAAGI